jgi:hypothetical protein
MAANDDVRSPYRTGDVAGLADDDHSIGIRSAGNVAADFPLNAQNTSAGNVAVKSQARAEQRVGADLRVSVAVVLSGQGGLPLSGIGNTHDPVTHDPTTECILQRTL